MYFGMTHDMRKLRNNRLERQCWFAWRPVRLADGRWVWLDYVWRRWSCDSLAPTNCGWTYSPFYTDTVR